MSVGEPSWQIILHHKDIVELMVAPLHTEEPIWYLATKISEHRHRFLEVFPQEREASFYTEASFI